MDSEFIWLAIGIAVAGYFIGNGLKNFQNPNAEDLSDLFDDDDEHELLSENNVHYFMGISKEDAKSLIEEHPDVPHIKINNKIYFPKGKLREWLKNIGA